MKTKITLLYEKVYRELTGSVGIGRVHHYGTYGSSNVMVMDLLGASLEDLFTRCGRRFSLKTTLKLADQLLERCDAVNIYIISFLNMLRIYIGVLEYLITSSFYYILESFPSAPLKIIIIWNDR